MTFLYNCRHSGDEYKITKFDSHFSPEGDSSYLLSLTECTCPAGHRPTCRHREMLPKFIQRGHIGDEWFWDHDRGGWVQGPMLEEVASEASEITEQPTPSNLTATEVDERYKELKGSDNPLTEELVNRTFDILEREGLLEAAGPTCEVKVYLPLPLYEAAVKEGYDMKGFEKQGSILAEQAANRRLLAAGGTISTHYMTNGSVETFRTIEHKPLPAKSSLPPTIRRRV